MFVEMYNVVYYQVGPESLVLSRQGGMDLPSFGGFHAETQYFLYRTNGLLHLFSSRGTISPRNRCTPHATKGGPARWAKKPALPRKSHARSVNLAPKKIPPFAIKCIAIDCTPQKTRLGNWSGSCAGAKRCTMRLSKNARLPTSCVAFRSPMRCNVLNCPTSKRIVPNT